MSLDVPNANDGRKFPVLDFIFSGFMFVVSTTWMVSGRIYLPNKGVFLEGTLARVVAGFFILVSMLPVLQRVARKLRKN